MKYADHSKFAYKNYDEIYDCINNGELDIYDIIYTKDTHENVVITPDYVISPVRSKIYRFMDVESAEIALNNNTDTYEGQIVSILYKGKYTAYIVNRDMKQDFVVSPLSVYSGEVSYDDLGKRPIVNMYGSLDNPILLEQLNDGIYKIKGQYKVSSTIPTVFSSVASNLFLVQHSGDKTNIKKISADSITDYKVTTGSTETSVVPTTDWLKAQGYVTEGYVDNKIAALDFITKAEIEDYVANVVLQNIDQIVNERIDKAIDNKIQSASEKEMHDVFVNIYQ